MATKTRPAAISRQYAFYPRIRRTARRNNPASKDCRELLEARQSRNERLADVTLPHLLGISTVRMTAKHKVKLVAWAYSSILTAISESEQGQVRFQCGRSLMTADWAACVGWDLAYTADLQCGPRMYRRNCHYHGRWHFHHWDGYPIIPRRAARAEMSHRLATEPVLRSPFLEGEEAT